ncbi:MAG: ABC transporter ATP-binding protein/permease [Clostridia bacterium]|nr:ABC transporter ATP-binding protein/permease [Clostridia bacterium]
MLTLKNIFKNYSAGDSKVEALKGVDIEFRKNEFVAVLGPSGCGKTTLLNIVGGLDSYTSGDLIINGRSTKEFTSKDWDSYRNHSIGFVFQSYNLIPHQSVLSNVELALTLSGVSRAERRKRAKEALTKVGLADQLHKKPNQMSGGQMQRVAIARALVNDPEILLADEPTGALDTKTSVQIMDILKEISKDKLIIMVTHNPELAESYATRTVKLIDGKITEDSDPYHGEKIEVLSKKEQKKRGKKQKKASMSFLTALSLSLNNLMTKKTRTFLTSFAGSIGIIGIALILSVSSGVQIYINRVQENTLSSYPLTIQRETVDMTNLMSAMMDGNAGKTEHDRDKVYASPIMYDLVNKLNSIETNKNNLSKFKEYLESEEKFDECVSAVKYTYDLDMSIYTKDSTGKVVKSDVMELMSALYGIDMESMMSGESLGMGGSSEAGSDGSMMGFMSGMESDAMMSNGAMAIWEELLSGKNGELINDTIKEQYDVVYGKWPENYDEIVLVVDENNEISDLTLYALGLKTADEMMEIMKKAAMGEQIDTSSLGSWSYEELCERSFRLIPSACRFRQQSNGTYTDLSASETGLSILYDDKSNAIDLKIVGIIRESENAVSTMIKGSLCYTEALLDKMITISEESELVKTQLLSKDTDVLSGLPFPSENETALTDAEKAAAFKKHLEKADISAKALYYTAIMSVPDEEYLANALKMALASMTEEDKLLTLSTAFSSQMNLDAETVNEVISSLSQEEKTNYLEGIMTALITEQYAEAAKAKLAAFTVEQLSGMLDAASLGDTQLAYLYDNLMPKAVSDSTYEKNLSKLGYVDRNNPSSINIYAASFEKKDAVSALISDYNESVPEDDRISYTDYVALLMSSITTIISAISYVLIAFVAISLVVSSIMIGIITYISVLERTKEIGILRSIGASKRDISRVFNAETLIVGFASGAIGIGVTLLFNVIINIILHALTGIPNLNAVLPTRGAVILVLLSMLLTALAGLIPSRIAANKDPVVALRTE